MGGKYARGVGGGDAPTCERAVRFVRSAAYSSHPMSFRVLLVRVFSLVAGVTLLSACDSSEEPPLSVSFNGVTYIAIGQASLQAGGSVLEVEDIGTGGGDGVRVEPVDGALDTLGVVIQPLGLVNGAQWGLGVFGQVAGVRTRLATAWAEGVGSAGNAIQFEFAPELGIDSLMFEYLLDGVIVARSPNVPAIAGLNTLANAGTTDATPNSVHAVREGGVVVVGTDYRGEALTDGPTDGAGCTAALIVVPFQPDAVCADFVRARPPSAGAAPWPTVESAEITGRSINRFVITDGALE